MRERDNAGRLELVERGQQFVEAGGLLGDAGFLESCGGIPDPARHVDANRNRIVMAVGLQDTDQGIGKEFVPPFLLRDFIDVIEHALLDEVEILSGDVELRRCWRVTADDAVDGHRACLIATGNCRVDPYAAGSTIGLRELLDGFRLTARGPPVYDFSFRSCRLRVHCYANQQRRSERRFYFLEHPVS